MKKLIGTAMLAALLATSAFAEGFSFGAWNNMNYVIANNDSNSVESAFMQPWGPDGARFGSFIISADSENAGFKAELQFNNWGGPSFGQVFSYVKPIEQIQLIFGFTDQNYLRSDNCAKMWDYWRPTALNLGEGLTFDEFEVSGIGLVVTPIESLKIFAGYDVDLAGKKGKLHEQIGRSGKLGAAYTIGDIGTVKAGVWANGKKTNKDGEKKDLVKVEAAFDLTAIEGMFLTVGAKIPLGGTYGKKTVDGMDIYINTETVQVNAGVALNLIENLGIQLNFASKINAPKLKDNDKDGNFGFALMLGADYTFAETWKVFAAVGYANDVYNSIEADGKTTKDQISFGVGIEKSWSNASLGIAVECMTNDGDKYFIDAHNDTAFNWAIPIRMNVSF